MKVRLKTEQLQGFFGPDGLTRRYMVEWTGTSEHF